MCCTEKFNHYKAILLDRRRSGFSATSYWPLKIYSEMSQYRLVTHIHTCWQHALFKCYKYDYALRSSKSGSCEDRLVQCLKTALESVCGFHTVPGINSHYFPKQNKPAQISNREAACFISTNSTHNSTYKVPWQKKNTKFRKDWLRHSKVDRGISKTQGRQVIYAPVNVSP
jgi:hypothetical protein